MHRIVTIPGRHEALRGERLRRVERWMAARGWRLADYAPEAGSALFEREADAPPLGWLDATRWLPAPQALRPRNWLLTVRADPRLGVLPAALLVLALLSALSVFAPPSLDVAQLRREAAAEAWRVVTVDQLNVRAGPSTGHTIVGVLYHGQRVLVEGRVDDTWVKLGPPTRGYVAGEFLAPAPPRGGDGDDEGEPGADAASQTR